MSLNECQEGLTYVPSKLYGNIVSIVEKPRTLYQTASTNKTYRYAKTLIDKVGAVVGILLLSPLFIITALAVRISSKGPIFFRQRRVGYNGLQFNMLKFRSMRHVDDSIIREGWTVENDPRRTWIGIFIRKYNIDELPQLFNVLRGQMSLVGPRPEQPGYVDRFKDEIPHYLQRHNVKLGMTGWAQVNGLRGDTSISKRTKYDLFYVENKSLVFDIRIILLTIGGIIKGLNAY